MRPPPLTLNGESCIWTGENKFRLRYSGLECLLRKEKTKPPPLPPCWPLLRRTSWSQTNLKLGPVPDCYRRGRGQLKIHIRAGASQTAGFVPTPSVDRIYSSNHRGQLLQHRSVPSQLFNLEGDGQKFDACMSTPKSVSLSAILGACFPAVFSTNSS